VKTQEGWVAMVIDAHSRRIIGWAFSASLHTEFVVDALLMAVSKRGGTLAHRLVFHSDRGVQYTNERFRSQLAKHAILASMSRKGNCCDNAKAEAFFSTLKIEFVYRTYFESRSQARSAIFEWIEAFYNLRRRHTSIGGISPVDFENQLN
jgi:putative transposase